MGGAVGGFNEGDGSSNLRKEAGEEKATVGVGDGGEGERAEKLHGHLRS